MRDHCADYDRSAQEGPRRGPFPKNQKNPDGIQKRLDESDDAGVKRACAAGDAVDEQDVRDTDLDNAEKRDTSEVANVHYRECAETGWKSENGKEQIAVNHGDGGIT